LKNIANEGEPDFDSVTEDFSITSDDGKTRVVKHYNLDAIIAVGFRMNSKRAAVFRQWATDVLRDYALRGYVIDRKRMENGAFLDDDHFERLLEEIREIRLSERGFYQKITDIYATSMDYDSRSRITLDFFAKVPDKTRHADCGHTAAELMVERAAAKTEHMGLTSPANRPNGKIVKSDVSMAENHPTEAEPYELGRIVNAYLDLAENRAKRKIPMTMEDWAKRLDIFLEADEREVSRDAGKITSTIAKIRDESEFEKYRVIQDKLFQSGYDRFAELERQIDVKDERSADES
jgi:hypothetical protein